MIDLVPKLTLPENPEDPAMISIDYGAVNIAIVNRDFLNSKKSSKQSKDEWDTQGVYILLSNIDSDETYQIYVGQTKNLLSRLSQHNKSSEKEWWKKAVIFYSKRQEFTLAHVTWLETYFIEESLKFKNSILENAQSGSNSPISEEEKDKIKYFFDMFYKALWMLGYSTKEEILENPNSNKDYPDVRSLQSIKLAELVDEEYLKKGDILYPTFSTVPEYKGYELKIISGGEMELRGPEIEDGKNNIIVNTPGAATKKLSNVIGKKISASGWYFWSKRHESDDSEELEKLEDLKKRYMHEKGIGILQGEQDDSQPNKTLPKSVKLRDLVDNKFLKIGQRIEFKIKKHNPKMRIAKDGLVEIEGGDKPFESLAKAVKSHIQKYNPEFSANYSSWSNYLVYDDNFADWVELIDIRGEYLAGLESDDED